MNPETNFPETLTEAVVYFSDPENAHNFMVGLRWAKGVTCPCCGSSDVRPIPTRRTWECKSVHPKRQFSVKVGTIFEDSPLPLSKWLATIWLIANAKNGISSYEVHRAIKVTQKTAWFMLHRIRLAMQTGTFEKLKGDVEVDETFIGGKSANKHVGRKTRGTGPMNMTAVVGLLERGTNGGHSKIVARVARSRRKADLQADVLSTVEPGSFVATDALKSYEGLSQTYIHEFIDHAVTYVRGKVHTNGLENFWSLLKRTLKGTYVSVDPVHLMRYLDEQVFRFNNRKTDDASRFLLAAVAIVGKRLTYRELISNPATL
ncbi:MAG TPA: IS1595 family transposase [Lacunisphaera sp.]|nr:IS1595 family transposase [Lacunisphaera sp.]